MAAVERRARELQDEVGGRRRAEDQSASDGGDDPDEQRPPASREYLVRARDELLRTGQIDGALLARGPVALRASWLSSRQVFGIVDGTRSDAAVGDDRAEQRAEESPPEDGSREEAIAVSYPATASIGFGRGLLNPLVQQSMLTGELARVRQAREAVHHQLGQMRSVERLAKDEAEEVVLDEDGDEMMGSGGLRRMQAEMRKRHAKQERRQRGLEPPEVGLGRRQISEQSQQAIEALSGRSDDGSGGGSVMADVSRGHRYLELAAPFFEEKKAAGAVYQKKSVDPRSKAALREAVADGEVDSAARHLRRGRISADVQHATSADKSPSAVKGRDGEAVIGGRGGGKVTKKQRKQQAALRRQAATRREADALGHPVCCCCQEMVMSASLRPPHCASGIWQRSPSQSDTAAASTVTPCMLHAF